MMKKYRIIGLLLLTAFVLVACTDNQYKNGETGQETPPPVDHQEPNNTPPIKETPVVDDQGENLESISLTKFFLPHGTKAHYKGIGNEFAELSIDVHRIGKNFVVIDEDNGGVLIRKIFQVEEDTIGVVSEEPIDLNKPLPSKEELNGLEMEEIYLKKPLEVGAEFEDWTIVDIQGTIETPYQNFNQVIIIESVSEGFTNRRYLVPDFGEVMRESIMETDDETNFIVSFCLKID